MLFWFKYTVHEHPREEWHYERPLGKAKHPKWLSRVFSDSTTIGLVKLRVVRGRHLWLASVVTRYKRNGCYPSTPVWAKVYDGTSMRKAFTAVEVYHEKKGLRS